MEYETKKHSNAPKLPAWDDIRYDMRNPSHRNIIYEFEREFNDFVKRNPDKYFKGKDGRKVGYKEHWMQELGIIKITGNNIGDFRVVDPELNNAKYQDFKKKWSALQDVRIFRSLKEIK